MAFERAQSDKLKIKGDSLDAFVSNLSRTFADQVQIRNAEDEANFQRSVLDNNLTLDDQLAYRKKQLKDVSDDPTESSRIKTEISGLSQRIKQKTFTDAYTQKIINYNAGASSVDSVISWLKDQLSTATDQSVIDTINSQLQQKQSEKFSLTQSMLKDQTDFAVNDKTGAVLTKQIDAVSAARATALIAGNDAQVAALDLQMQALTKAKTESAVTADINNFAVSSISGYASATKLLDAYNSKIQGSPSTGPVTIGGTTYDSEQQFWTFKRDTYLSDNSGSGFFPQISQEASDNIKTLSSQNLLTKDTLSNSTSGISALSNRPELASYTTQITNARQTALQSGADLITSKVIENQYTNTLDLNKAITDLTALKALGVNVEDSYAKILNLAANTKTTQVNGILSAAQNAMQNDPTLTAEQAIKNAVAAGAGTVISPEQAKTQTETQIATAGAAAAKGGTAANDPRTTVEQPPTPLATPAAPGTPAITTPASTSSYVVKSGDTLSAIAKAHNTTVAEIAKANNISDPNKIQSGATLKIPAAVAAATPSTPVATPSPTTVTPAVPGPAATAPTASKVTAPITPAPTPTPAPQPAAVPTSGYTFSKEGTNIAVFQNGARVSTTTVDNAKNNFGYTGS